MSHVPQGRRPTDPAKRIAELEAEVRRLSAEVTALREDHDRPEADDGPEQLHMWDRARVHLVDDVKRGMDFALGGEEGESFESRVGAFWLSLGAALLIMTGLVLFVSETVRADYLNRVEKLGIVYVLSFIGFTFGLIVRNNRNALSKTVLGCSLAGLYYATYAAFFVDGVRLFPESSYAIPVLLGCLVFIAIVTAARRSQTVAGISLFLVYYTVLTSGAREMHADALLYALGTGIVCAMMALLYMALFRWLMFTWLTLIAIYGTHIYYFWTRPESITVEPQLYFLATSTFLSLSYLCLSVAVIIEARTRRDYRRMLAPLALANSALYFVLMTRTMDTYMPESMWVFRLAFAAMLTALALFAETAGPHRNDLFQVFILKTVIMISLTLEAYLEPELLLVAFAAQCILLGVAYNLSGIVALKGINLALLAFTLAGGLTAYQLPGDIVLRQFAVDAGWFAVAGTSALLFFVTWYYERVAADLLPAHRTLSGHWFLADSRLDINKTAMAMAHAGGAALILLMMMVFEFADRPTLPFMLTLLSGGVAVLGVLARTPQICAASVPLLVAAHVTYHFFFWDGKSGFLDRETHALYSVGMALYTYCGAMLWERFLARDKKTESWEFHAVAALPYLMATYLLIRFVDLNVDPIHGPLAVNGLGIALILVGGILRFGGIKAAAVFAMSYGTTIYALRLVRPETGLTDHPHFAVYIAGMLISCAAAERIIHMAQPPHDGEMRAANVARLVLITAAGTLGLLAMYVWAPPGARTMLWMAVGLVIMGAGVVLDERYYRWVALCIFTVTVVAAFVMTGPWEARTFAALGGMALLVSAFYSRYRQRILQAIEAPRTRRGTQDG